MTDMPNRKIVVQQVREHYSTCWVAFFADDFPDPPGHPLLSAYTQPGDGDRQVGRAQTALAAFRKLEHLTKGKEFTR